MKLSNLEILLIILFILFASIFIISRIDLASALELSECSFFNNATTCEQLQNNCQTALTGLLIEANKNLSNKVSSCLIEEKANSNKDIVTYVSLAVSIIAMGYATYYRIKYNQK